MLPSHYKMANLNQAAETTRELRYSRKWGRSPRNRFSTLRRPFTEPCVPSHASPCWFQHEGDRYLWLCVLDQELGQLEADLICVSPSVS